MKVVQFFAREGATIVAVDLPEPDSPAAQAIRAISPEVQYQKLDISSEDGVKAFYQYIKQSVGTVDILVNNAGIILGKPLGDTTLEDWDRLHSVNGRGTFMMMRGVLAVINKQSGSVVNISSGAAIRPLVNLGAYSASKAAINALTKAAAYELAPVRFNVICPGPIDTPMPRKAVEKLDQVGRDKVFSDLASVRALKRLGLPEEVASVVLFLASDEASYVTGMEFNIDGGKP